MPLDGNTYDAMLAKHGFIPANHSSPNWEDVVVRKVYDEDGVELPGYKHIFNATRKATIQIATDKYELVPNEVCFAAFETAINASPLDKTDMHIARDMTHGGGRTFCQYLFPAHAVQVKPGVEVALRIVMFNSYDGTTAFRGLTGAFNFVCANTAVIGAKAAEFSFRHIGDIDVEKSAQLLVDAATAFVEEAEGWKRWPEIAVTDREAIRVIEAVPGATEAVQEHLKAKWLEARTERDVQNGPNLWALYNVMTAWATHTESRGQNGVAARYAREGVVRRTMETTAWKALAAAA